MNKLLNKSFVTNLVAVVIIVIGYISPILQDFNQIHRFFCPVRGNHQLAGYLHAV